MQCYRKFSYCISFRYWWQVYHNFKTISHTQPSYWKEKEAIITITFIVLLYRFAKTTKNLSGFQLLQWTFSLVYLLFTAVNYHLPFRLNHNCPHIINKTLSREPQAHLAEWPFFNSLINQINQKQRNTLL